MPGDSKFETQKGKLKRYIELVTTFRREVIITQGDQVPVGLQHHIPVQGPLNRIQAFPLFLSEFYSHILECKQSLKGNISPNE